MRYLSASSPRQWAVVSCRDQAGTCSTGERRFASARAIKAGGGRVTEVLRTVPWRGENPSMSPCWKGSTTGLIHIERCQEKRDDTLPASKLSDVFQFFTSLSFLEGQ